MFLAGLLLIGSRGLCLQIPYCAFPTTNQAWRWRKDEIMLTKQMSQRSDIMYSVSVMAIVPECVAVFALWWKVNVWQLFYLVNSSHLFNYNYYDACVASLDSRRLPLLVFLLCCLLAFQIYDSSSNFVCSRVTHTTSTHFQWHVYFADCAIDQV